MMQSDCIVIRPRFLFFAFHFWAHPLNSSPLSNNPVRTKLFSPARAGRLTLKHCLDALAAGRLSSPLYSSTHPLTPMTTATRLCKRRSVPRGSRTPPLFAPHRLTTGLKCAIDCRSTHSARFVFHDVALPPPFIPSACFYINPGDQRATEALDNTNALCERPHCKRRGELWANQSASHRSYGGCALKASLSTSVVLELLFLPVLSSYSPWFLLCTHAGVASLFSCQGSNKWRSIWCTRAP